MKHRAVGYFFVTCLTLVATLITAACSGINGQNKNINSGRYPVSGTPQPIPTSGGGPSSAPPQLTLVAANAIQAGVTVPDAVWADANYVYLANVDGHLRVIDKHQPTFPVIADVPASTQLYSVRGDNGAVYATANAGQLFRFSNQPPFAIQASPSYATIPLLALEVDQSATGSIIISEEAASAADAAHVYVDSLDPGENALAISKTTGQVTTTYAENPVDPSSVAVFDRSGSQIGTLPSPTDLHNDVAGNAIYSKLGVLAIFTPGCCGRGVYLYDASTLAPLGGGYIEDLNADTVAVIRNWLVVGTERGTIDVYDISNRSAITSGMAPVATIDLRTATGHNGIEDIEIRAIWVEASGAGVRIYAASSWGNSNLTPSYRNALPSFFVIDLKYACPGFVCSVESISAAMGLVVHHRSVLWIGSTEDSGAGN